MRQKGKLSTPNAPPLPQAGFAPTDYELGRTLVFGSAGLEAQFAEKARPFCYNILYYATIIKYHTLLYYFRFYTMHPRMPLKGARAARTARARGPRAVRARGGHVGGAEGEAGRDGGGKGKCSCGGAGGRRGGHARRRGTEVCSFDVK